MSVFPPVEKVDTSLVCPRFIKVNKDRFVLESNSYTMIQFAVGTKISSLE